MEVLGKVRVINPEQQISASFKKRELVVSTDEQFVQHILIEFAQDKCDLLNEYKIGENVKVSINLRGREWVNPQGETKFFNSIQGWRIEKVQSESTAPTFEPVNEQPFQPTSTSEEEDSDLPF